MNYLFRKCLDLLWRCEANEVTVSELPSLVESKGVSFAVLIDADDVLAAICGIELDDLLVKIDPVEYPDRLLLFGRVILISWLSISVCVVFHSDGVFGWILLGTTCSLVCQPSRVAPVPRERSVLLRLLVRPVGASG